MKTVLITGANRGIGLETTKKFLQEGYHVLFGSRNKEKGQQVIDTLQNKNITLVELDVASDESVMNAIASISKSFDHIDVLINNAAINYDTWHNAIYGDFKELTETINVNLMGSWRMIQAVVPIMERNGFGRIINMSSGAGQISSITSSTPGYAVSKTALNALTINVSKAVKGDILVNALCPGWVRTDMGGMGASRSAADAATDIYELSQSNKFNGKFVRYGKVIEY